MKDKNMKIISYLRKNAREPLTKISKGTNIPVSTIFDRLKDFEKDLIKKHTSLIDFSKLGYLTCANMVIKFSKEHKKDAADYLYKHANVNSLYKITNGHDYMVEVVFKNLLDFQKFNEDLEERFNIEDIKVYFIINDIKREEFMADVHNIMFY
jgi:DNA-binding Lrp family transcriptional regulator